MPTINKTTNNTFNIALTGKMRSGKDTTANYLARILQSHGYLVNIIAFGDALKENAHRVFPDEVQGDEKPRELYQWFGQTMRQRDPDVWVKQVKNKINKINESYDDGINSMVYGNKKVVHIITDLRQPNEYEFCVMNGFKIIKVECSDEVRLSRMNSLGDNFSLQDLKHETENYIDMFNSDLILDTSLNDKHEIMVALESFIDSIIK